MPPPDRQGGTLLFRNHQGVVTVEALSSDIIRVRFVARKELPPDHSYAVLRTDLSYPRADILVGKDETVLRTQTLRLRIRHDPFLMSFATAAGEDLDEDDPARGIAFLGDAARVWKRLLDDEHVYGFGEKNGRLDKRGRQLGGYSYTMWNSDTYAYDSDTDPIYASVPFFMVVRKGRAHGIFFDNTYRSTFEVGRESQRLLSFGAEGGGLNYYFLYGPSPKEVIERYTELTGRMPLPPRWALGYHQCRYSYYPEAKVRFIAENLRLRRIPADVIWLDIHYLDSYKPFTWDHDRFPDPRKLLADLRQMGLRTVTIVDPHPKKEPGYGPYDSGVLGGHFVRNPDASLYEAPVWPSPAERNPGPSVFPDFTRPGTREWWGGLYAGLLDLGVAGIWNDMNEPAVFQTSNGTMPLWVRHDNEGRPTDHSEVHNVYGMLMSRATYEGLLRLRPNERPFVLTRASFAGGQRYAALWPGDNQSDWTHLRASIPMLLGMGLSGLPFVGSDIGGFAEVPSAELYTRWLQCGVFYPFMRTHATFGKPDQEPWSYGTRHEDINRRSIELRYELLPHIYNVMQEASSTGVPALRPVFLEFPEDPKASGLDDEFFFGRDLLVAPVLRESASERSVYLPSGDWYDFWTTERHEGGRNLRVKVGLDSIPIFVRGGAFVFRQGVIQHTGEMAGQALKVFVFPATRSEASFYEDDGETQAYRKGALLKRRFEQRRSPTLVEIEVGKAEGEYRPAPRALELWIPYEGEPSRVAVDQKPLARARDGKSPGWSRIDRFILVRLEDRWDRFEVSLYR